MDKKKVLFISGSLGLGHVGRDIEIAKALRKIEPEVEISWLADDPATMVLLEAGENLMPETKFWAHGNAKLGNTAKNYTANLMKLTMGMMKDWKSNAQVVANLLQKEHFDLVVGDETYELVIEMGNNPGFKTFPFIMIYDFVGLDSVTRNPIDVASAYIANRIWIKGMQSGASVAERSLFVGEVGDVPDKKFGFMLPNRRALAIKTLDFLGYILSFNPEEYRNNAAIRKVLGYGDEPLIVCSIGGTSAGKELLSLCAQAYPLIKEVLPGLRMVLVCGPMLQLNSVQAPEGVDVKGYVPELYKHLAAADLCIVTGGGTVTLELTALQKPFLYFPLKHHFEQEADVARRCERHGAGVKMDYSKTSPELLAKAVLLNFGKEVNYAAVPTDGAQKAAQTISEVLSKSSKS
jgi:UDP-N-acetylglucosamine:LPS N-acetylglucosamine transferase